MWAVVRFERGNVPFSAHTTVGDRPFASYRGRARDGFAQLKAHSYGAAIPTGRWNWKISVGGKERAKAEVTLVAFLSVARAGFEPATFGLADRPNDLTPSLRKRQRCWSSTQRELIVGTLLPHKTERPRSVRSRVL